MHRMNESAVLALLKRARNISGLSLDFWDDLTYDLDHRAIAIVCGKAEMFPKYMKSSVIS